MTNEETIAKTEAETEGVERTRDGVSFRPNVDILERPDELLVMADVPGAKGESIDIKFEDGMLEIHAAVAPRECYEHPCLLSEYGVGDYYRSFQISEAVDASKVSAQYADGVLTLHLPKSESLKPRKIAVTSG